jgi:hypothetical protein
MPGGREIREQGQDYDPFALPHLKDESLPDESSVDTARYSEVNLSGLEAEFGIPSAANIESVGNTRENVSSC